MGGRDADRPARVRQSRRPHRLRPGVRRRDEHLARGVRIERAFRTRPGPDAGDHSHERRGVHRVASQVGARAFARRGSRGGDAIRRGDVARQSEKLPGVESHATLLASHETLGEREPVRAGGRVERGEHAHRAHDGRQEHTRVDPARVGGPNL